MKPIYLALQEHNHGVKIQDQSAPGSISCDLQETLQLFQEKWDVAEKAKTAQAIVLMCEQQWWA